MHPSRITHEEKRCLTSSLTSSGRMTWTSYPGLLLAYHYSPSTPASRVNCLYLDRLYHYSPWSVHPRGKGKLYPNLSVYHKLLLLICVSAIHTPPSSILICDTPSSDLICPRIHIIPTYVSPMCHVLLQNVEFMH